MGIRKMLPQFKMAARGQLKKICGRQNSKTLVTFPTIWRCAGDFFMVLLKLKMAATDQPQFFCGQKHSRNYSHSTITFPTIWRYPGDFTEIENGHHKLTF